MNTLRTFLFIAVTAAAQQLISVHAPNAQALVLKTKAAHSEIHKIGIHATPPDSSENVIIAADIPSKIGKKSSAKDMELLASGKPSVTKVDKDQIYDLLMALADDQGRPVGFVVMEIPLTMASDEQDALRKGMAVRDEMQKQIKSKAELFQ
jgi:hypothetical protein